MDGYWVAQAVGIIAAVLGITAFQLRRDTALFLTLAASAFVWALHFLLLGAIAAALLHVVTGLRNLLGIGARGPIVGVGFAIIYTASALWGWESGWDLLPLIAVLSGTAAVFFLSGIWVRVAFLIGSALWVIYSIRVGSIPGIVMMAADGLSNLTFIIRAQLPWPERSRHARGDRSLKPRFRSPGTRS